MALKVPKYQQGQTLSHARARQQEKELAALTGGKQTPASGAGYQRGDVRVKGFMRIEAKTTKHQSFSVTAEHVKLVKEAVTGTGEIPIMVIELGDKTTFCVLPMSALEDILEALRNVAR